MILLLSMVVPAIYSPPFTAGPRQTRRKRLSITNIVADQYDNLKYTYRFVYGRTRLSWMSSQTRGCGRNGILRIPNWAIGGERGGWSIRRPRSRLIPRSRLRRYSIGMSCEGFITCV